MDTLLETRPAATAETAALVALTAAFETDPPVRWLYPGAADYTAHFPSFARALGGAALAEGTADCAPGGAALWLAPGVEPDEEALGALVAATIPAERHDDVFAVLDAMGAYHPEAPHWYLPLIGVAPEAQGRGLGTRLMQPVLDRCDAEGTLAYLEATTERSAALYARLGFERTGTIRAADCPDIIPMVRRPG